jgi:anaerobic selenocysteine-containing dehydrogenase
VEPVRLTSPLVRDSGVLRPSTWDEALDRAAAVLRHTLKTGQPSVERLVVQDFLTSSAQLADVVLPASALCQITERQISERKSEARRCLLPKKSHEWWREWSPRPRPAVTGWRVSPARPSMPWDAREFWV